MKPAGRKRSIPKPYAIRWLLILLAAAGLLFWACDIDDEHHAFYHDYQQVYPYDPGWYKGALHSHAFYEASPWITPIADVVDIAEGLGLHFFVITNHNTIFPWYSPGYQSRTLTLLYGVEWTTGKGHANIWSNQPFAYHLIAPTIDSADAKNAIRTVHELSTVDRPLLFSINHPDRPKSGGPSWQASSDASRNADAIEVWNRDDVFVSNADTFPAYISQGRKMTMVGGSDAHLKNPEDMQTFTAHLTEPTTWVYADSRSGKDLLRGIRQGHVFISAGPHGPRLDFFALSASGRIMMGDAIPADALGQELDFSVAISNATAPYGVVIIKNGQARQAWSRTFAAQEGSMTFTDTPQAGDYYRIEVRQCASQDAAFDELLLAPVSALSNPIYTW